MNSCALEEANMIGLVRLKDGTILRAMFSLSPILKVEGMIRRMKEVIAPIPANAKCKKIVTVYATLSLVKMKLVT